MVETKYGKYIITEAKAGLELPSYRRDPAEVATGDHTRLIYLDEEVIKGAFYVECVWYWEGSDKAIVGAHTHPFDEVITFFGTNPEDPQDLCGEVRRGSGVVCFAVHLGFRARRVLFVWNNSDPRTIRVTVRSVRGNDRSIHGSEPPHSDRRAPIPDLLFLGLHGRNK